MKIRAMLSYAKILPEAGGWGLEHFPLGPSQEAWPCPHPDLRHLASRSVKKYTEVTWFVSFVTAALGN